MLNTNKLTEMIISKETTANKIGLVMTVFGYAAQVKYWSRVQYIQESGLDNRSFQNEDLRDDVIGLSKKEIHKNFMRALDNFAHSLEDLDNATEILSVKMTKNGYFFNIHDSLAVYKEVCMFAKNVLCKDIVDVNYYLKRAFAAK